MKRKTSLRIYIAFLLIVLLVFYVFDTRLLCVQYEFDSPKVDKELRFAVVADLHSCSYGTRQHRLVKEIEKYSPDAVFLVGDFFDDVKEDEGSICLLQELSGFDLYYVSGNHEWWSGRMYEMFDCVEEYGATTLRGDTCFFEINGQIFSVSGIDDPQTDVYDDSFLNWSEQLEKASESTEKNVFSILLSHRPEKTSEYKDAGFDLVISGHAHGGQFRIPYILNGFYAPNQGFAPKYAGGQYDLDGTKLVVSRGLAKETTRLPRIFNRPELVFITVK